MTLNLIGVARARGGGSAIDLSSPPPIGDVAPNTGAFTTLVATSTGVDYATKAFRVLDSNNVSLMTLTSDGRVFAGVDTTDNYKLAVTKSAADAAGMGLLLIKDNLAGGPGFVVRGSGSANIEVVLQSVSVGRIHFGNTNLNSQQLVLDTATGNLGVGTGSGVPAAPLHAIVTDAATATVTDSEIIGHNSSGTSAASFGTGLLIQGQSSTTVNRDMARLRALWTTATDASRVANLVLSVWNIGVETDVLTLNPSGMNAIIGATTPAAGAFTTLSGKVTDAATNTVTNVLTLGHETSGTPAASYGTGLAFQGESSTTSNVDMGRIRSIWTTATHASRVSNLILSTYAIGVETTVLTLTPTGSQFALTVGINVAPTAARPLYVWTGNLGAIAATNYGGYFLTTYVPSGNNAFGVNGLVAEVNVNPSGTANLSAADTGTGVFSNTVGNGASGATIAHLMGFYSTAYSGGAATVTTLDALRVRYGTASTGTVGTAHGVYIDSFKSSSGPITNLYGLYINDKTQGSTLNYAIYTNAGLVRFGGDNINIANAKTPASAAAAGIAGDICWDAGFLYVCTATNTWERVAIATW